MGKRIIKLASLVVTACMSLMACSKEEDKPVEVVDTNREDTFEKQTNSENKGNSLLDKIGYSEKLTSNTTELDKHNSINCDSFKELNLDLDYHDYELDLDESISDLALEIDRQGKYNVRETLKTICSTENIEGSKLRLKMEDTEYSEDFKYLCLVMQTDKEYVTVGFSLSDDEEKVVYNIERK